MSTATTDLLVSAITAKIVLLSAIEKTIRDDCPVCETKDALVFSLSASENRHLRGQCTTDGCDVEFIE